MTWTQQIEAHLPKTAMAKLDQVSRSRSMKAPSVMVIHDALRFEASQGEAGKIGHLTEKMMASATRLTVPMEIELI